MVMVANQQDVGPVFRADQAQLNITWNGQNGDLPDPVRFDATDAEFKQMAAEAVETGYVPGINAGVANFNDFVVTRFAATDDRPFNRVVIRPKTPFGVGGRREYGVNRGAKGTIPQLPDGATLTYDGHPGEGGETPG
jgi:hypothetical protein